MTSLAERLRDLRRGKGLTLDQLASLSGSSKSYIWELENKNPPRPSAEKLSKIAEALETTVDFLIGTEQSGEQDAPEDVAFFRKYKAQDPNTKKTIREMLEVIKKNG